jgi:glyoxylase-like metal-dependent hydrolase (beta-lactamase superfamily II)
MDPLNAWLVDSGDGWVLIDTGMQIPSSWNALDRGVRDAGVAWEDVRHIVITHMHPDHVGLVLRAREASGAPVLMHGLDADLLNQFAVPERAEHWNGVALGLAGSPPDKIGPVNAAFHMLTVKFPSLAPDRVLQGGERIGRLEVIWTPGHSPGHVCLFDRERKLLFGGDHILETTSPNIGWLPDGDPLGDYLESLRSLVDLDIDVVLPGHGGEITDHRAWIAGALAHHAERLERIAEFCAERPLTAHELSTRLWQRELDPINYRFAIFEVLAHQIHAAVLESTDAASGVKIA